MTRKKPKAKRSTTPTISDALRVIVASTKAPLATEADVAKLCLSADTLGRWCRARRLNHEAANIDHWREVLLTLGDGHQPDLWAFTLAAREASGACNVVKEQLHVKEKRGPGRPKYNDEVDKYVSRLRAKRPSLRVEDLWRECIAKFGRDRVSISTEAFKKWLRRRGL